ncbi:lamin tail domain-containing protein [Candidatus Saccharibacteria bacterium]|nr:lamin tail domain-containing protein [Candidatus Saccharibacteria bacterium]
MMRRTGGLLLTLLLAINAAIAPVASAAITTTTSSQPKIDGPLLITGYSFSGHSVRYVQIYNSDSQIVTLDGWRVGTDDTSWQGPMLHGILEPHKKILVADPSVVMSPTVEFSMPIPKITDVRLSMVRLIPPTNTNWNEQIATITTTATTVNVATSPATYYFSRNVSTTTGNYLTTYTAFVPTASLQLEQDPLYQAPSSAGLTLVEVYPSPKTCAPTFVISLCQEYVKLHNPTTAPIDLSLLRLRVGSAGQSATTSNTSSLRGVLAPDGYVSIPIGLTDAGSWAWLEDEYGITRYDATLVSYPSASSHSEWSYAYNHATDAWQWTQYPSPDGPNTFMQSAVINQCGGLRLSEIAANNDTQFIEVYNAAGTELDIGGCQLQTNRSQTASYVFPADTILPTGSFLTVPIASTSLTLTKTTSGTVYILNSDGSSEVDARSYENLDASTALALVGGTWLQTFTVTPGVENQYSQYPACEEGYVRNTETGRCNKVEIVAIPTACLSTQYRSSDTGRCRNVASSATSLTPCMPGQYRSAETNRCRSLVTAAGSQVKPCGVNQERNPSTNRCRNSIKSVSADFPVEAVKASATSTVGWWAFGGVGALAVGYAGWEWRREAAAWIKKIGIFSRSSN